MTKHLDRRRFLAASATAGAAIEMSAAAARAEGVTAQQRRVAANAPLPLPFDPAKIKGLSEKLLLSHYENNYIGAIKRLNAIAGQLAALDFDKAPGFQINGLKREELIATNSMILHEVYFAGRRRRAGQAPIGVQAIDRDFGGFRTCWRSEFVGIGKALGGGLPLVMLAIDKMEKLSIRRPTTTPIISRNGDPLLVLGMFEHAIRWIRRNAPMQQGCRNADRALLRKSGRPQRRDHHFSPR